MYNNLAKYYDYIFPAGKNQLGFFKNIFQQQNVSSVLDLACGTGNYSIEFARWGLEVTGVDYEATMVDYAKQKANEESLTNVKFLVGDMRNLSELENPFDAIVCIGNSLVHILTDDGINKSFQEMNRLLKPNGLLLLQILNYDHIIAKNITTLSDIVNEKVGLVFSRQYEFRADGYVNFNTSLILNNSHEQTSLDTGSVILRPLRPRELQQLLVSNGFNSPKLFGDFKGTPLEEDNMTLVVTTSKG